MCREKLGVKAGLGAVWLTAIPPDTSMYGTGDKAVALTKVRQLLAPGPTVDSPIAGSIGHIVRYAHLNGLVVYHHLMSHPSNVM